MNNLTIQVVRGYEEPDRKYRTLVTLQRADRPKYWTFHCPNCQQPMAELNGTDLFSLEDFYNPQSAENRAVGIRCPGPHCRRWYYFQLQ